MCKVEMKVILELTQLEARNLKLLLGNIPTADFERSYDVDEGCGGALTRIYQALPEIGAPE